MGGGQTANATFANVKKDLLSPVDVRVCDSQHRRTTSTRPTRDDGSHKEERVSSDSTSKCCDGAPRKKMDLGRFST